MKNKKILISLVVFVALLCLGIGYAAISRTLIIGGGVKTGEAEDLSDNFIVYFSKVETNTDLANGATVAAEVEAAAKSLYTTFYIENMNKVGSKVVLTYTVTNDSEDLYANGPTIFFNGNEVNANQALSVGTVTGVDPYFTIKVTPNIVNGSGVSGQADPKSEHTITIEVEMTNSPLEKSDFEFQIFLQYEAGNLGYSS